MRVMIAQFAGITDVHSLVCQFTLAAMTQQLGCAHENFNAKARADGLKQNWRCFYLAWVTQLVSWIIIFNYFGVRVSGGNQPDFIWVIIIIMFLLDSSFAITFTLQWAKIPPFDGKFQRKIASTVYFMFAAYFFSDFLRIARVDYVVGERTFIVLSFFAKTLLAWIGFGGVYQRY